MLRFGHDAVDGGGSCCLKGAVQKNVRWVVSDGHTGIQAAVTRYFGNAVWQRYWTRFIRNILAHASRRDKPVLSQELCVAWWIANVNLFLAEAERIAQRWECKYPRLAAQIREQLEQALGAHDLETDVSPEE